MSELITAPLFIIAAAFFAAVGIVWMLFLFILLTKSAKDVLWAKAQSED